MGYTEEWTKMSRRKKIVAISLFGLIGLSCLWVFSIDTGPSSTAQSQVQDDPAAKAEAQEKLDELMALGKKSGLVTAYEFSDSATVVYVGNVWYTQTVQFKKDFLASIGMLKKQITGYQHLEIRDAYSNEKVAEITAFGGSLEVYR